MNVIVTTFACMVISLKGFNSNSLLTSFTVLVLVSLVIQKEILQKATLAPSCLNVFMVCWAFLSTSGSHKWCMCVNIIAGDY